MKEQINQPTNQSKLVSATPRFSRTSLAMNDTTKHGRKSRKLKAKIYVNKQPGAVVLSGSLVEISRGLHVHGGNVWGDFPG